MITVDGICQYGETRNHRFTNTFDMQDLMRSVRDDLARLPRLSRVTFPVRTP
jgi:hypothetical protein